MGGLFCSSLGRLLSLEKRLTGRKADADIIETAGDATLASISAVGWARRQYLSLRPGGVLKTFDIHHRQQYLAAECELASSAVQVVAWSALGRCANWCYRGQIIYTFFTVCSGGEIAAEYLYD